jgi:uncharacterized protein
MFAELIISVVIAAFLLEFFDASIGMGYGEITALLLLLGFAPLEAIPAVLITGAVLNLVAAGLHHEFKNVNFSIKSKDFKISLVLTIFGGIGIVIGILLAIKLPEIFLKIYIGVLVMVIGIIILLRDHKKLKFSWKKIIALGSVAAFNKGMTGGGYGPVLTGGQIISGVEGKKAVSITTLTEALICIIGFIVYVLIGNSHTLNWSLIISLLIGGLLATPLATYAVKKIPTKKLVFVVGIISIILGIAVLIELFL